MKMKRTTWIGALALLVVLIGPSAMLLGQSAAEAPAAQSTPVMLGDSSDVVPSGTALEDSARLKYTRSRLKFFTLDHATFRYDKERLQLEIYALIDRSYLGVEMADSGIQASYEITFQVLDANDSLLIGDSWVRKDWSPDSTSRSAGQKIPELIRYVLSPGVYRIAARVVDMVNHTYYVDEYPAELDSISNDSLAVSDIILASRIEKTSDDVGEFDHNGLLVLPNAERMFGLTNPQVYYYAEIYNLTNEPGARYTVNREVLNQHREVIKPLDPHDREVQAPDLVDIDGFNIGTLRTGAYILQLIVTDETTGKTATSERNFWVYRRGETQRMVPLVDPGFDIAALTDAEVAQELDEIRYLMNDNARGQLKQLNSPDAKRHFLARFWASIDPDTSTAVNEFRQEYMRRLDIVNDRYGNFQRPGWKTDRGRVFLINGEPSFIEDHPFDSDIGRAYQVWEYHNVEGGVIFVFVDRNNLGDYIQVHSTKRGEINNPNWWNLEMK